MNVELDKNLDNKVILKKRTPAGKSIRYIVVTCIGCNQQREVVSWKWTSRNSDYCKMCFAKFVASKSKGHIKHGLSTHPLYTAYKNMLRRCHDPNNHNYQYYGNKGIVVCEKWRDKEKGLQAFFSWSIANGWEKGLQLDRIDNDGNYSPENVQYITQLENLKKMENLFGIKGRKVKKGVVSTELLIEPPEEVDKFKKLDEFINSSSEEEIENLTLGC